MHGATAAREGGGGRGASAFLPVVCFTACPATAMMKSKAAVVWHGETKQPEGGSQNGRRPHSSAATEAKFSIRGHQIFI